MKIIKIEHCIQGLKECFYVRDNMKREYYECIHPDTINKFKSDKYIFRYSLNIKIPKWCPLEDYNERNTNTKSN